MELEKTTQKSHLETQNYYSEFGSVVTSGDINNLVTFDGDFSVPVPADVAEVIRLALKVQDKVHTGKYPNLTKLLGALNCRKTALITSSSMAMSDAFESGDDINALEPMFEDVERLLTSGMGKIAEVVNYSDFASHLDTYEGSFPCIVHLFESEKLLSEQANFSEEVRKMHRIHSFIVAGEDETEYVCFQKTGPQINEPFVICALSAITQAFSNEKGRFGYFVFGPYQ